MNVRKIPRVNSQKLRVTIFIRLQKSVKKASDKLKVAHVSATTMRNSWLVGIGTSRRSNSNIPFIKLHLGFFSPNKDMDHQLNRSIVSTVRFISSFINFIRLRNLYIYFFIPKTLWKHRRVCWKRKKNWATLLTDMLPRHFHSSGSSFHGHITFRTMGGTTIRKSDKVKYKW